MYYRRLLNGQKVLLPAQVAKLCDVSRPTAGKWAEEGLQGLNGLEVRKVNGRTYIMDTEANRRELNLLREKGLKYKNRVGYEKIDVPFDFVENLNHGQLVNIVQSLESGFFPSKIGLGGNFQNQWNKFLDNQSDLKLFQGQVFNRLVDELSNFVTISVLNCGYGHPKEIHDLFKHNFETANLLFNNVAILKPEKLPEKTNWIDGDIETSTFHEFFKLRKETTNVIVALGGYVGKTIKPMLTLNNITASMSYKDFAWLDFMVDSQATDKIINDYVYDPTTYNRVAEFLQTMGLPESSFKFEKSFDEETLTHFIQVEWTKDIELNFPVERNQTYPVLLENSARTVVDSIGVYEQTEILQMLVQNGLEILCFNQETTGRFIQVLCKKSA